MKTKLYLVRHGQTVWNSQHRMQGWADSPLSERGIEQAMLLGESLKDVHFDAVYASSTGRAMRTAELIRGERDLPVQKVDNLREIHMPTWDGVLVDYVKQHHPEAFEAFVSAPHLYKPVGEGETYEDLSERAVPAIREIAEQHAGQCVLVVSHTLTILTILSHYQGWPLSKLWDGPRIRETSLSVINANSEHSTIERWGDISHLG
ncbi:MAG: histidine phosphatase family protein [Anaerolineae bacterium]|nr:histidine phosphatase family protein [Anaerolineae bacterium]